MFQWLPVPVSLAMKIGLLHRLNSQWSISAFPAVEPTAASMREVGAPEK